MSETNNNHESFKTIINARTIPLAFGIPSYIAAVYGPTLSSVSTGIVSSPTSISDTLIPFLLAYNGILPFADSMLLSKGLVRAVILRYCSSGNLTMEYTARQRSSVGSLIATVFSTSLLILGLFALAVLLGAPLDAVGVYSSYTSRTVQLCTLLGLLVAPSLSLAQTQASPVKTLSNAVLFKTSSSQEVFISFIIYTPILYSWIATVVMALDWQRPWLHWPLPLEAAGVVGSLVGHLLGLRLALDYPAENSEPQIGRQSASRTRRKLQGST